MNKYYINVFLKQTAIIWCKRCVSNFKTVMSPCEDNFYKQAIVALNALQSNQKYINNINKNSYKFNNFEKFLNRAGIKVDDLDQLSIIHVSGTKGKGTTCAFCENILQQHGYKTGFFSSPHLLEVRERIRVNGIPLEREKFGNYFWDVYRKLDLVKEHSTDMPGYFAFLTIVAFYVFLKEKVDVALVEVGIGGESDCTNIIK
ncbi:folylpolyglutamate synthase, mitochondrial-like [Agrilus planipennis]|nr:folylpolyglutamate synthase, mitochondrial-like [Agrilus planipennis]